MYRSSELRAWIFIYTVTLPGLGGLAPAPPPPSPTAEGYVNPPVTRDRRQAQTW